MKLSKPSGGWDAVVEPQRVVEATCYGKQPAEELVEAILVAGPARWLHCLMSSKPCGWALCGAVGDEHLVEAIGGS
jgi:hypothetical protein